MSKLIYITNASLDGYIEDRTGAFDWGNPDQVFDFITELMRPIGTHLLGRRLYETMTYWDGPLDGYPPEHRGFARVWQKAEQIVFSRTLTRAPTRIARVEREFDPEATRKLAALVGTWSARRDPAPGSRGRGSTGASACALGVAFRSAKCEAGTLRPAPRGRSSCQSPKSREFG